VQGARTIRMGNFVLSIVEAIGSGRMALDSMTTWAFYYGSRPWDNEHWGKNASTFSWDLDGGFYMQALLDGNWIGNNRVMQYFHGPHFSGLIKQGVIKPGEYYYSLLDTPEGGGQIEKIFFSFFPHPKTPHNHMEHVALPGAGASEPLLQSVEALKPAFAAQLAATTGKPAPLPLSQAAVGVRLRAKAPAWLCVPGGAARGALEELNGGRPSRPAAKKAKRPNKDGLGDRLVAAADENAHQRR